MQINDLEKYSSAITLSDMEIFVYPELMYSLVLANIMSPVIWQWKQESSFKKLQNKNTYRKFMRLKQYIMDEYEFNLDLETWGLTTQETELKRFEHVISRETVGQSNALFGYTGDKYYFDVDIRKHFGLDKYDSNIIPYWKTETVEAMNAFQYRKGYSKYAGECVSLAALYAAAAFIVSDIPLEDICMILTPLHSQNYIDLDEGILTNNRRVVTKTMWFNGSATSNKAQRALRNERVTIVAHSSGYIHCIYDKATIDKSCYEHFRKKLGNYLNAKIDTFILANFLRCNREYQGFFQFCCEGCRGGQKFAKAEDLFQYEHDSKYRIDEDTFENLIEEISDEEEVLSYKLPDRLCCKQLIQFLEYENLLVHDKGHWPKIKEYLKPFIDKPDEFLNNLYSFVYIEPRLPSMEKEFIKQEPIILTNDMKRQDVIDYLSGIRDKNQTADLAFYAYRDMQNCDWRPFIKAAVERNPVIVGLAKDMNTDQAYQWLRDMKSESIYDGQRAAQPDEVVNYERGSGFEKAIALANLIKEKQPGDEIEINVDKNEICLKAGREYSFENTKTLQGLIKIKPDNRIEVTN